MDALGDILAPYSEEISKFTSAVTCLQFLSGVLFIKEIFDKKSSDVYSSEPLVVGIVLTTLSMKFGIIIDDNILIKVNLFGFVVNIIFLLVFYWYASNNHKKAIWKRIVAGSIFVIACIGYSLFEDQQKLEFRFGLLISGILILLVGSPLLHLGEIMKSKSSESLPFPIILSGTIVAASWSLYGIALKNNIMTYQNLFLLFLSSIQLSLFAVYPNRSLKEKSS